MNEALTVTAVTRFIESSPVIVIVISFFAAMVWRTWRLERGELLNELREERNARSVAFQQMVGITEKSTEAIHAVRDAVTQLRQSLDQRPR